MSTAPVPTLQAAVGEVAGRRTIPFEYAFRFDLTGARDNVINKTVTVSIEATFVAVSIGYGVIPRVTPITFGPELPTAPIPAAPVPTSFPVLFATTFALTPAVTQRPTLRDIPLGVLLDSLAAKLPHTSRLLKRETGPEAALKVGIALNPAFADRALSGGGKAPLDPDILKSLFRVVGAPPEQILFKYALHDDGSGREFQSEPILSIAGLGIANGDRPFRHFVPPIKFAPQSTIRMEVTEISDFPGELHISLHGYKVLGGAGTPTGRIRRGIRTRRRR